MKTVLVIGAGWEQRPLLEKLIAADRRVIATHPNEDYERDLPFAATHTIDPRDLEALLALAREIKPDAVISDCCDYSYFAQALIAREHGLPGPGLEEAQIAVNKYLQRLRAQKTGVLIPEFSLCAAPDQASEFARETGFPIILKPVDNRGGFGVTRVDNEAGIEAAFIHALIHSHSRLVLAERFITGLHVTAEAYAFGSGEIKTLAVSGKKLYANGTVASAIAYPGALMPDQQEKLACLNETVAAKLGYRFGPIHAEYMLSGSDFYLIEAANRGGGVLISECVVPAASGYDQTRRHIADALGETYAPPEAIEKNPVTLKFLVFGPGTVRHVEIDRKKLDHPDVLAWKCLVNRGDRLGDLVSDTGRHAFVIVRGDETKAADFADAFKVTLV